MSSRWIDKLTVRLSVLMVCLLAIPALALGKPRASFDRGTIFEGETVILTIELDQQAQGIEPDLAPLQIDFHVLGQSTGTELQLIGGRQSASTQWTIELEPKHSGELRVPALQVGSEYTSPMSLKVLPQQPVAANQTAEDIFLEVKVQPENPYVQSQVRYTVRLFYAIPLLEGALGAPSSVDAVINQLGEDASYVATRNGRRYRVFERNYAIFPEKSGALTLPAISFRGRVTNDLNARSLADQFFNRGRRLRLSSEPLTLDVQPRPESYQGNDWLPAEELTLKEAWPEGPPKFRPGEPVTRTLILEAKGLNAAQLPELPALEIPRLRVYPDQPVIETSTATDGVLGRREERMALIPTEAGELTLPEVRVHWWDTKTDEQRVAVLPARTITVAPAAPAVEASALETAPVPESVPEPVPVARDATPSPAGFWPWLSAGLMGLWLLTLVGWWREHLVKAGRSGSEREPPALGEARRALRRACGDNDAERAARALLAWAAAVWPENPPKNLGAVATRLAGDTTPVQELDRALYAPNPQRWSQGAALWACVKQGPKKGQADTRFTPSNLPPLYPKRI